MFKPQSISEKLMFSTVRISCGDSLGTGFFMVFEYDKAEIPLILIITNQHVIKFSDSAIVKFEMRLQNDDGSPSDTTVPVEYKPVWIFHDTLDLCCCLYNPLYTYCTIVLGRKPYIQAIPENVIPSQEQLNELNAIEEVMMVGYPNGLIDTNNKLPIYRRGVTAFHPALDFGNPKVGPSSIGIVDMSVFPGSSGSPICIVNDALFSKKNGATILGGRIYFLGVAFKTAMYAATGKSLTATIPNEEVQSKQDDKATETYIPINLGYYIKSKEIYELRDKAIASVKAEKAHYEQLKRINEQSHAQEKE